MSRKGICSVALLCGVLCQGAITIHAQQAASSRSTDIDVAVTYVAERAKIATTDCGCFWLSGGSANVAFTFFHGLGIAANLTGVHASEIQPGVDLDKVMFAMGPRYTYSLAGWRNRGLGIRGVSVFGEGLIGGVHGFNTVFPSSRGVQGAASSFAIQTGGGVDLLMTKKIGIRIIEADYVRSTLPNNGNNTQNDLRLAAGISFHFRR